MGAFLVFKSGGVLMAGLFAWVLARRPEFADELPAIGWQWWLNFLVYLAVGIYALVHAHRMGSLPAQRDLEGGA